jgi:hypothetical protein
VPEHVEGGGLVLQLLGYLLADPDELPVAVPAAAILGRHVVDDRNARQGGRKGFTAVSSFPVPIGFWLRCRLGTLCWERLPRERKEHLVGGKLLGPATELMPAEQLEVVGKLLDLLVALLERGNRLGEHLPQDRRVVGKRFWVGIPHLHLFQPGSPKKVFKM